MAIFKNAEERLAENYVYELVAKELQEGFRKDGLWLRAATEAEGDEQKTRRLYVRYRVQEIKDELNLKAQLEEEAAAVQAVKERSEARKMELAGSEETNGNELAWLMLYLMITMILGVGAVVIFGVR